MASTTLLPPPDSTVASVLLAGLQALGVRQAYGVPGGAMAALWHALGASGLQLQHCRHETGAAFAAIEAHFASGAPVLVFTTTGPGLCNALTGLLAARGDGARVLLVSACTSAPSRGRGAIQESSPDTLPAGLYTPGPLFHQAAVLEQAAQLPAWLDTLAAGLARPGGWVAHLALPTALQNAPARAWSPPPQPAPAAAVPDAALQAVQAALADGRCALWLGHGARGAAAELRALVQATGMPVLCTPRAKGIVGESHPACVGVSGVGGHESVHAWLQRAAPQRWLVLGTRLGEASSLLDTRLIPPEGLVQVDADDTAFGAAFPQARTVAVRAEIGALLRALLARPEALVRSRLPASPALNVPTSPRPARQVRPERLMAALQSQVVEGSTATLLADSGNAFIWTTHLLRFAQAGRYRVSTGVGAMGQAAAGALGAALASGRRAVAVVGDGAMLMHNEINTAVKYQAPVLWIVLNDARYGMCAQGMQSLGLQADAEFPAVDFAALARAQGATGLRVASEAALPAALRRALAVPGPVLLDVLVDRNARAPAGGRNRALARLQAQPPAVAAPATRPAPAAPEPAELAFPLS